MAQPSSITSCPSGDDDPMAQPSSITSCPSGDDGSHGPTFFHHIFSYFYVGLHVSDQLPPHSPGLHLHRDSLFSLNPHWQCSTTCIIQNWLLYQLLCLASIVLRRFHTDDTANQIECWLTWVLVKQRADNLNTTLSLSLSSSVCIFLSQPPSRSLFLSNSNLLHVCSC